MSLYIDRKYVLLASPQLSHFKQKSDYLFNCRCPICGDSKKNKNKARGYFYRTKDHILYKCHNCHASMSLGNFLKAIDTFLFDQYRIEVYKEANPTNVPVPAYDKLIHKPVFNYNEVGGDLYKIPSIASLPNGHFAKEYVAGRRIPEKYWKELFFAEDFRKFIDETFPEHNKNLKTGEPRLIIPFFNEKKILQGCQGRAFGKDQIRYITIRASDDMKKVFGLDRIDFTKPIHVVEGPLDSLFLENSIATMDASLHRVIGIVGDYDYIFVHDNEPRNKEILKAMRQTIETGKKVCIWSNDIEQKDINDMVLAGLKPQEIIYERQFSGMKAKLEFEMWRKA
jgi:hypothetical protein